MNQNSRLSPQNIKLALVAALAIAGLSFSSASMAASATALTSSTVVAPIAITKSADLVFGKFAASTGGNVVVSTAGARTVSGGVISMNGTAPSAAKFDVTGEADASFSISLPATSTLTAGGSTMTFTLISDLTGGGAVSGTVSSGTLTAGAQTIYVGGDLVVASAQVPGTYAGSIQATVEYN